MVSNASPAELRPLDYAGILSRTVELYTKNFALFVGIVALAYVPLALLQILLYKVFPGQSVTIPYSNQVVTAPSGTATLILTFFNATVPFLVAGAMIQAVSRLMLGRSTSIAESWRATLANATPLVLTGLLCGLLISIGIVLLIIPGLVAALACVFAAEAVVLERRTLFDAVKRSAGMVVRDNQWIRVVVLGLFMIVAIGLVQLLVTRSLISILPYNDVGTTAMQLIATAFQCVLLPVAMLATIILYFDIRFRQEGYGLQSLQTELEGRAAPYVPSAPPSQGWSTPPPAWGAPPYGAQAWASQQPQGEPVARGPASSAPPWDTAAPQQPSMWGPTPGAPPPPPSPWGTGVAPSGSTGAPPAAGPFTGPPAPAWGPPPAAGPPVWGPTDLSGPPHASGRSSPPDWSGQSATPGPAVQQAHTYCGQCGAEVTTRFCMQCGAPQRT